jgi:lipoate-protein ligase B
MLIYVTNLGISDYRQAWHVQHTVHAHCHRTGANVLLLTQHYPVVTLGYRRPREQLRLSVAELQERGIALVEVERGGGATYHGPGQLLAYPIFSSLLRKCGVRDFVARLEEVMRRVSWSFGVPAARRPGLPGIWVGEKKLGAVGIAVRRGVSLHGSALNVNLDLHPFSYLIPCGLADTGVTSLEQENGAPIPMSEAERQTCLQFATVFSASMEELPDEWCGVKRETRARALDYH